MTNSGLSRRNVLRGMAGGAAVTVGLPFLDCFLNTNGTAFANGAALPACFVNWFQGLGFNPGFWEPKIVGASYAMAPQLEKLTPFKSRINIYSGMKGFSDGRPVSPHTSGPQILLQGGMPRGPSASLGPSLDQLVADAVGTRSRFRSLEVNCYGAPINIFSQRGGGVPNPSEPSPVALYTRIFGPDFKDPNAAEFTPDPAVMIRRSALSAVTEQRKALMTAVGASDRERLDQYFTSVRDLENQLDLALQKPAPLEACSVPGKPAEAVPSTIVDDALRNHKLFAELLAHALACGQTRVATIDFGGTTSNLRHLDNATTFHMATHEEPVDPQLGYQPTVAAFQSQVVDAFLTLLTTLDSIREGDHTLLDRVLVLYSTDTGLAKVHSMENIPMMTAGSAGGRMKTGYHIAAQGEAVTRVGLTIQQIMGMPVSVWGSELNQTSRPFTEIMALT